VLGTDGIPHKPAPDLLWLCARTVEREAKDGLMVGDTERDVLAGKAAGMHACGVTWGVQGRAGLAPHAPHHLVDSFAEIYALVT
jgi:phosphoglycolate phosphatase